MAIFVFVVIAFFFGMVVQWLARVIFTFNYTKKMKYSIVLFGGVVATAIIYFMLIKQSFLFRKWFDKKCCLLAFGLIKLYIYSQ